MKKFFKNIKTTLFGSVAGLPLLVQGIQTHNVTQIIAGIGTLLLGLVAKDAINHDSE